MSGRLQKALAVALGVGALALAGAAWLGLGGPERPAGPSPSAGEAPVAAAPSAPAPAGDAAASPRPGSEGAGPSAGGEAGLGALDPRAAAWDRVDLEAVREAMPNNLYWKLGVPTQDAALLREREEFRERLNEQYGTVLSNTGSEQQVRDYFETRRRMSADYVEFTTHLLDHYGDVIPERDVGLLKLARELHLSRLEEIPKKLSRALERREEHAEARRAWLEQERRFAGEEPAEGGGAPPSGAPAPAE